MPESRKHTAVILRSALLRASRRMAARACGPSFEARREERRAPLAITAKPLRGDDGGGVSMVGTAQTRLCAPYDAVQLQFGIARFGDGTFALTVTPRKRL